MRVVIVLCVWSFASLVLAAELVGVPPDRLEKLAAYIDREAAAFRLPGVAVAVVTPAHVDIVRLQGRGVSSDAAWTLGSCSKTVTALATLLAARTADVSLETPVTDLMPELKFSGRRGALTIRHLLEHRSGFDRRQGFAELPPMRDIKRAGYTLRPAREPGEFAYCNLNYALLGLVIEELSGVPFVDYVCQVIFEPLGMDHSYAGPPPAGVPLVPEYQYLFGFPCEVDATKPPTSQVPAGFVRTSITDLGKFWQCLMNQGRHKGRQVFPAAVINQMATPSQEQKFGYGMGLSRQHFRPVGTLLGHEGATSTSYACTALFPGQQYGLLLLTNINLFDPFTDPGSAIFANAVRILAGEEIESVRPYKIWLRYGLVGLLVVNAVNLVRHLRRLPWARWPLMLPRRARGWAALAAAFVVPAAIWALVLWWTEIPLAALFDLEPDLAWSLLGNCSLDSAKFWKRHNPLRQNSSASFKMLCKFEDLALSS